MPSAADEGLFGPEFFSKALANIKPSPTATINGAALAKKAAGEDVITLAAGEPDFDLPQHVKDALCDAVAAGKVKYTATDGIIELKQAIVDKLERSGLSYDLNQITVGTGGKQVLFNALFATLNPGDEVIIPAPYWVSYPDMVTLAGGVPVILPSSHETGYRFSIADLEAAITPRTKWFMFNSPSNPSGVAIDANSARGIVDVLEKNPHVAVITDEIYELIGYDDFEHISLFAMSEELRSRGILINGGSKAYSMTGLRLGYGAGPAPLIKAMAKLQSQSTGNPCSTSQWAMVAALNGPHEFLKERNDSFKRRRDFVVRELNEAPGIECLVPDAAFYVYPSCERLIGARTPEGKIIDTDETFALELLASTGVALVHGGAFGVSPNFRVSYATSDEVLSDAMARIRGFCDSLVGVR